MNSNSNYHNEKYTYEHYSDTTILGRIECYRKTIKTCRAILYILERNNISERNRIIFLRLILIRSKDKYKNFVRRFRYNDVYRDMLGFVRSLVVMFNTNNLNGMKDVLRWKIGEYDTILGDLNAILNNHAQNNAFSDITRTTNNATNRGS